MNFISFHCTQFFKVNDCPHLTNEKTEAQKCQMSYSKSDSWLSVVAAFCGQFCLITKAKLFLQSPAAFGKGSC